MPYIFWSSRWGWRGILSQKWHRTKVTIQTSSWREVNYFCLPKVCIYIYSLTPSQEIYFQLNETKSHLVHYFVLTHTVSRQDEKFSHFHIGDLVLFSEFMSEAYQKMSKKANIWPLSWASFQLQNVTVHYY